MFLKYIDYLLTQTRASNSQIVLGRRYISLSSRHNAEKKRPNTAHEARIERTRMRNIGIIAHINAGKTTTTERILFLSGRTDYMGDVDKGNTVTDYLVQERDRGITITSAAVAFNWRDHHINLIDTPGHVDFTMEVERSLSVLDGAITIIDSSAGVEAQTITVWNQASKYQLPNIIFLNKYDKSQADYKMCMKDLKLSLGINAHLVHLPVKPKPLEFTSVIDIIERQYIKWIEPEKNEGTEFTKTPLSKSQLDQMYIQEVEKERETLVNYLTDIDEELAGHVIECDKIGDVRGDLILRALRRATIGCKVSPVFVGSSFKYIGVQQLMDSIVEFLPSPIEREQQIRESLLPVNKDAPNNLESIKGNCAFIFKIMHDKRLGALNYVRVCNGSIERLQRLKNLDTDKSEQAKRLFRPFADELREINEPIYKDDIVVLTGLSESRTGDILVDPHFQRVVSQVDSHVDSSLGSGTQTISPQESQTTTHKLPFELLNQDQIIVPRISRMEPVYFCSIEAPNISQQLKLEHALASMSREDPSFTFEIDSLGITTIRGMGRLHLEVARDRIESEYGIGAHLGPLQISYRETMDGFAIEELTVNRLINSVKNTLEIKLYVRSAPNSGQWMGKKLRIETSGENNLGKLRHDHRKAIELGLMSALQHGPSMGYPMIDCDILLLDFKANGRCGLPLISSSASQCLQQAIKRCSPVLLEPIMLLEVVAPHEFAGLILADLTGSRRSIVLATTSKQATNTIVIRTKTPLATLTDYSEHLRILTSGRGSFSMELNSYSAMSDTDKQNVVRL